MAGVKKVPLRQCVGCREMKDKKTLIRVIKNEEGVFIDETGKKNGRGAYICPSVECLNKAIASKGLERSFKSPVETEVYDKLKKELEKIEAR